MTKKQSVRSKYHWIPDVPDVRDHMYAKRIARLRIEPVLPTKVDLRPLCSTVESQGALGSCTGQAIVGALEFLQRATKQKQVNLSRLFVYYNERVAEGTVNEDAGAIIRTGIKSVATTGVCKETLWPYKTTKFRTKPTDVAYADAGNHKAGAYERITSLDELRHALANNRPVVFGISVYDSFESDAVAQTGVVPMPKKGEQCLGGHAILAVGYDDVAKRVICRNSWGSAWGQKGYFTLPYAYITNRGLSDDFWTILT